MYKCFIYDFDGVVCDSVNIKTDAFLELYRLESEQNKFRIKKYHLENGGISRFEKLKYFENTILNRDISQSELLVKAEKFSLLVKQKVIDSNYIPGIIQFLNINSSRRLQFVCTGTPENEIVEIVKSKNLNGYFNDVYGSPKTKVEIIERILKEYKLAKTQCLFFGDTLTDFNAARMTNIDFFGIRNDSTSFPNNTVTIENFYDNKLKTIL